MISYIEWNDFLININNQPENSLDFVLLISAGVPINSLSEKSWLDAIARTLRPGGLLFIQGKPEVLPAIGVYLDQLLTFKYWIAVESSPPRQNGGLPSTHAAILLFTKGKSFDIQKVRFPHQICKSCGKPLRDWGGKSHLMHPDGYAISDVWKDLPLLDNINSISKPALETILKLLPAPIERLQGLITPASSIGQYPIPISLQTLTVAEPHSRYTQSPLQYSFPNILPQTTAFAQPESSAEQSLWNRVIQGDILEVLRQYPDESVDLVFADPPYNLDKAYNSYNDEIDRRAYLEWCNLWLDEYIRILKPSGSLYLLNLPRWAMYHADYLNRRLVFQNWIVWDALSEPRGKIMPAHYALLFYTRQPKGFTFNYQEVGSLDARYYCLRSSCIRQRKRKGEDEKEYLTDIWWDIHRLKHRRDRDYHPCQLPESLMERIIRLSTNPGDVVVDALSGTGTTAVVAARLGRRYVAIDLDEKYIEITRKKLEQIKLIGNIQRSSTKRKRNHYSKKALQIELQEIARQLGRLPTPEDVQRLSQYELDAFLTSFPSWGKALKAAKLEVSNDHTST